MKIICITPIDHLKGLKSKLSSFGKIFYKPDIKKNLLNNFLIEKKIDIIFCNPNKQGFVIDENILKNTNVKAINTVSTGLNHIDLSYCKKYYIKIYSLTKDYPLLNKLPSTSELSFGLMINLLRNINSSFQSVKKFQWNYLPFIGRELSSLKIGIIGFGRLGKFMAKYSEAFGMDVLICDPHVKQKRYKQLNLINLCKSVDVISLHIHSSAQNKSLINSKILNSLNKKPIIINTSRGDIVNEKDIIEALDNQKISGYGCDVIADEFTNVTDSPIIKKSLKSDKILITPHVGGMTIEGQYKACLWSINKMKNIIKDISQ